MNLLNYAQAVEPCQRNWDHNKPVLDQDIEYIVKVCTTMPTRQNLNAYQLHVVTDKKVINDIYKISYNPSDFENTFLRNSQSSAPLLLIWSVPDNTLEQTNLFDSDVSIAVGISSSAAALSAAELGYKTGFCKCFLRDKLKEILNIKGKKFEAEPIVILGIGYPKEDLSHSTILLDDGDTITKKSFTGTKNIKITKI